MYRKPPRRPITDERFCLKCYKDLEGTMGCYIFVGGSTAAPSELLLCGEHGANGANGVSAQELIRLVKAARREGKTIRGFGFTVTYTV